MSGGRHLFNALPEDAAAAHNVSDLCLVTVDLDRAGAHEICGSEQVNELWCHFFLSFFWTLLRCRFQVARCARAKVGRIREFEFQLECGQDRDEEIFKGKQESRRNQRWNHY